GLPPRLRTVRPYRRRRPGVRHDGNGQVRAEASRAAPSLPRHERRVHTLCGRQRREEHVRANFYSVDRSIRAWVKANGCNEEPATEELRDQVKDGTKVLKKTYGGGKDGAEVVLVVIEGGGHTWPGRPLPERSLGKVTANVSANDLMWEFFEKHPMKEATGDGP